MTFDFFNFWMFLLLFVVHNCRNEEIYITKSNFFYKNFFTCNPKLCINQAIKVTKSDFFDCDGEYTIGQIMAAFTLIRTSLKKSPVPQHQKRSNSLNITIIRARIKMKAFLERIFKIAGKPSGPDAELEDISLIASQITDWFIMISDNMSLSLESSTLQIFSGFV